MTITNILKFPGLGLEFKLEKVAFLLFGMSVHWYAIIIGSGIFLCGIIAYNRAPKFGIHKETMFDISFFTFLLGVIGAKLYYVLFSLDEYRDNWLDIFEFSNGGLGIFGGVIGGILAVAIYSKAKKIPFLPPLDNIASVMLLGQGLGRWGNFVNIEAYGGNTSLPWGMTSDSIVSELTALKAKLGDAGADIVPTQPVHPYFLYEFIWCMIGFIIIQKVMKNRKFDGEVTAFCLAWYGFGRFMLEGIRTDSLYIGNTGIRVSQLIALILFVVCGGIMSVARRQLKIANITSILYVDTAASKKHMKEVDDKLHADKSKSKKTKAIKEDNIEKSDKKDEENLAKEIEKELKN